MTEDPLDQFRPQPCHALPTAMTDYYSWKIFIRVRRAAQMVPTILFLLENAENLKVMTHGGESLRVRFQWPNVLRFTEPYRRKLRYSYPATSLIYSSKVKGALDEDFRVFRSLRNDRGAILRWTILAGME